MKKLEEALKNMSLPDIRVDEFKRELRRDLLNTAAREQSGNGWRLAFGWACAVAVALVCVSALFILKPEVPAQLNAWFLNGEEVTDAYAQQRIPDGRVDDPAVQRLLTRGLSTDSDQEFMRNWYRQTYPADPFQIESVEEEKIYAIRKFQLKGGKKVVVYTEVKGDEPLATY